MNRYSCCTNQFCGLILQKINLVVYNPEWNWIRTKKANTAAKEIESAFCNEIGLVVPLQYATQAVIPPTLNPMKE